MQRIFSIFNTSKTTHTSNSTVPLEEPARSPVSAGTAIELRGGSSVTMKDCMIKDFGVGVSMTKGSKIDVKGTKFDNVRTPFEVKDE